MELASFESVNEQLLQDAQGFLQDLFPNGKIVGKSFHVGNLQGDQGKSLKIDMDTGKWQDFSTGEKGGDLISLYAAVRGIRQGEALKQLEDKSGHSHKTKSSHERCLKIINQAKTKYTYHDKEGREVLTIIRSDSESSDEKKFLPISYQGDHLVMKNLPNDRPLFHLPKVLKADFVLLVEGEKCVDAASEIITKVIVTTWAGGANGVSKTDFSPLFGKKIIAWPDNDISGFKAMHQILNMLAPHCKDLEIVDESQFKDKPKGWDIADAVNEMSEEEIYKFITDNKRKFTPSKPPTAKSSMPTTPPYLVDKLEIIGVTGIKIYDCLKKNSIVPRHSTSWLNTIMAISSKIGNSVSLQGSFANFNFVFLMKTGSGKNDIKLLNNLLNELELSFLVGQANISSKAGLLDEFDDRRHCPEILIISDECHSVFKSFNHAKNFDAKEAFKIFATMKEGMFTQGRKSMTATGLGQGLLGHQIKNAYMNFIGMSTPKDFKECNFFRDDALANRIFLLIDDKFIEAGRQSHNLSDAINALKEIRSLVSANEKKKLFEYSKRERWLKKSLITTVAKKSIEIKEELLRELQEKIRREKSDHRILDFSDDGLNLWKDFMAKHNKSMRNGDERIIQAIVKSPEEVLSFSIIGHASCFPINYFERPIGSEVLEWAIKQVDILRDIKGIYSVKEKQTAKEKMQEKMDTKILGWIEEKNRRSENQGVDAKNITRRKTVFSEIQGRAIHPKNEDFERLEEKGLIEKRNGLWHIAQAH